MKVTEVPGLAIPPGTGLALTQDGVNVTFSFSFSDEGIAAAIREFLDDAIMRGIVIMRFPPAERAEVH